MEPDVISIFRDRQLFWNSAFLFCLVTWPLMEVLRLRTLQLVLEMCMLVEMALIVAIM